MKRGCKCGILSVVTASWVEVSRVLHFGAGGVLSNLEAPWKDTLYGWCLPLKSSGKDWVSGFH